MNYTHCGNAIINILYSGDIYGLDLKNKIFIWAWDADRNTWMNNTLDADKYDISVIKWLKRLYFQVK